MQLKSKFRIAILATFLPLALLLGGCDAESPTEPASQAQDAGDTTQESAWNITVEADPSDFPLDGAEVFSNIAVRASRVSNGTAPAAGTTAVLSTTLGTLASSLATGTSIPVEFQSGGVATATLTVSGVTSDVTIQLQAQLEGSFGSTDVRIGDPGGALVQVTEISPNFGPPNGGTEVQITGTGFEAPARAFFLQDALTNDGTGAALTQVEVVSDTLITAMTPRVNLPAGTNATYNLVLEQGPTGGTVEALPGAFTYSRSPSGPIDLVLLSVTPSSGPNEGGTEVLIRGDGFNQQVQVYFSNGPLIEATVLEITETTIRAVTPSATGPNAANANSRVDVVVRDPVSAQEATLEGAFQYGADDAGMFISAIGPSEDEYLGGTTVTVFGQGFDEPVAVEAGGVGQQPISVTGTEVVFRAVPVNIDCSDQSGAVSVTNIETSETVTGPTFTYRPVQPLVLGVSPGSGPGSGGNTVIVRGVARSFARGFQLPVRVLFNGRPGTVLSQSADGSQLEVVVPAFTDEFDTEDCESGDETGERNVPFAADVEVINLDTGCNDVLAEAYLYIPDDESCRVESDGGGVISP